jgi:hypothetical protein
LDTPGFAIDIAVAGDFAYLADVPGVSIIDISDVTAPVEVARIDRLLNHHHQSVAVAGHYLYIGEIGSGMRVFDITDPSEPVELVTFDTQTKVWDITIRGDFAYIAAYDQGLLILDISDPAEPAMLGSIVFPRDPAGEAVQVALQYNLAYVATDRDGVRIVDISDPTAPVEVGYYDAPWGPLGVAVFEDIACVASGNAGIHVVDIADPTAPVETGFYDTDGVDGSVVRDGYAYLNEVSGIRVLDISNPAFPEKVGFTDTQGSLREIRLAGDYLYTAQYNTGLQIHEISNPLEPVLTGIAGMMESTDGVAISGDYAFLSAKSQGIWIVDVSNPNDPQQVGHYDENDIYVYDVAASGSHAFILGSIENTQYLTVIDVSNPASPVWINAVEISVWLRDIEISGDHAYLATSNGLKILDISDPEHPFEVGTHEIPDDAIAVSVDVEGDFAIIGISDFHDSSIQVINVADPATPNLVGFYNRSGALPYPVLSGNLAYVADGGYFIYDISEALPAFDFRPTTPTTITLHPAYPNPFNPVTTIRFDLPQASAVTMIVYNLAGQSVETLVDNRLSAGTHTVSFDGSRFSSGMYFYTLKAGSYSTTRKMLLVK